MLVISSFYLGFRFSRISNKSVASNSCTNERNCSIQSLRISSSSDGNVGSRDSDVHATMINILLSISACAMVTVALHFFRREAFNQTTVTRCVQGMIAGDVVVAAGANIYPPYVSLVLGASNGILFYFMVRIIEQSAVEDYCNTMAIHLIPGLFGALVVPFFKKSDDGFDAINTLLDFSWQIICLLSIMGIIILIMTSVFMALGCCRVLRNRSEHLSHLRASAALVGQPTRYKFYLLIDVEGIFKCLGIASHIFCYADLSCRGWFIMTFRL